MREFLLHIKHYLWETWQRLFNYRAIVAYYKKSLWISIVLGMIGTSFLAIPTLFDLLGEKGKYVITAFTAFNFGISYLARTTLTPEEYAQLMAKKNELKAMENV